MDFRQCSIQIGTQQTAVELKASGGGGPLGSPSHNRKFSTVFHALSHKTDGSRGAKLRTPHVEADDRPSTTAATVLRDVSRKADCSRDEEPRAPQAETDDASSTTMSDVPATLSSTTSYGTDTESRASQSETGDEPSMTTSGSEPLLLSLLGATWMTSAPPGAPRQEAAGTDASTWLLGATWMTSAPLGAPRQEAAGTDASTNQLDGLSGISGMFTIQPTAQPAEGVASSVRSETGLNDLAGHDTTSVTGDSVAALSTPMPEQQPGSSGTNIVIPVVEKSDVSQPLSSLQGQVAESRDSQQRLPIMEHQETGLPQSPVPSGQSTANGQDSAKTAATVTAQQTSRNGEGVAVQPDRSFAQPILREIEPSFHQKSMPVESSDPHTAAAQSGYTKAEGQGLHTASDGQRKDEGLKWFSRADLQSAEVSSRQPQPSAVEPLNAGSQALSYQQGQGGTPSNSQSVPAPAVPPSSQMSRLSQDPATAPVPLTHAVQFDLAPADFGQLRVRVVLSDHTIHTHLSTDRAELGQMLTSRQEQLGTQLSVAGLDLGRFQVQVNQERTNHSGQEWQSQAQSGTFQQQRDSRQQGHAPETPVPSQQRTGMLSLFA